jgi:hypothetical protein
MAITRAQIARQLYNNGGEILGPLGEDDLTNQFITPGRIGRGLAFVLSGGATSAPAIAKEFLKQKAMDKAMEKSGDIIRPRVQTELMQQDNRVRGIGGYQSDFSQDRDFMGGRGTAAEMGSFADGGMIGDQIRQAYGIGDIVKKAVRGVKKVAKSPIGKAALIGLGGFGLAGMGPLSGLAGTKFGTALSGFFGKGSFNPLLRKVGGDFAQSTLGSMISGFPGGGIGAAITAASMLPLLGLGTGDESEEEAQAIIDKSGLDIDAIRANPNQFLARRFRAEGGSMKEPVAKKTMPLLDMGGQEMDLRAEGGFVPIGRMEKADDVPARLSKNEFVFTADAVRNAGDGNVDKGAEVMYNMMKNLEAGGNVSEESQGLEGARRMFQTSQRLEEVL